MQKNLWTLDCIQYTWSFVFYPAQVSHAWNLRTACFKWPFILEATLLQHKICMKITVSWVEGRNVVTSQDPWKTGTKSCICSNLWKKMTQPIHTLSYTSNHLQIAYNTKYRAVNSYQPWQGIRLCLSETQVLRHPPPLPWLVESTGTGAIGMGRLWDSYILNLILIPRRSSGAIFYSTVWHELEFLGPSLWVAMQPLLHFPV